MGDKKKKRKKKEGKMENKKEGSKQERYCIQTLAVGRHHQELSIICSITCAMSHIQVFQILPAERSQRQRRNDGMAHQAQMFFILYTLSGT